MVRDILFPNMNKLSFFQKGDSQGMGFSNENSRFTEISFFAFLIFVGFFIGALVLKLFQLTIVKGQYYLNLSENNRIREFLIEPKRGEILDRKGYSVAKNLDANIETSVEQIKKDNNRIISKRIYETPEAIAPLIGYRQLAE